MRDGHTVYPLDSQQDRRTVTAWEVSCWTFPLMVTFRLEILWTIVWAYYMNTDSPSLVRTFFIIVHWMPLLWEKLLYFFCLYCTTNDWCPTHSPTKCDSNYTSYTSVTNDHFVWRGCGGAIPLTYNQGQVLTQLLKTGLLFSNLLKKLSQYYALPA